MIIKRIELRNFRNYVSLNIDTEPGINVFYGDNAQGKTNILEAIYLCACARSHRTAKDSELIYHGGQDQPDQPDQLNHPDQTNQTNQPASLETGEPQLDDGFATLDPFDDQYDIKLTFINRDQCEETIELRYLDAIAGDPQRSRAIRQVLHNGVKLDKISDLMGLFHAVIFAPEDLMLVKEGPATRRRYLDLLISQIRPTYFIRLQQYAKYLQQRNKLLKDFREKSLRSKTKPNDDDLLQMDVWNQALAQQGAGLIEQRLRFTDQIAELAGKAQNRISSGKEKLIVKYRTVAGIKPDMSYQEIYDVYYGKLKNMVYDDIEKGTTGSGPHRDDLELSLDGDGMKSFASQGQQRSAVLALKLAELSILRQETGEMPVLLLDDVMSELDGNRRASLLDNIHDAQVFVTCTDAQQVVREIRREQQFNETSLENLNRFSYYHVQGGHVHEGYVDEGYVHEGYVHERYVDEGHGYNGTITSELT